MSDKKRKIIALALILAVAMSPMFAETMTQKSGDNTINLGFIKNAVNLIVGIFAGGYVLLKAALDIFHAVRNSSEDPNGLKKAIGGLMLNIAILGGFMFVINYVLASYTSTDDTAQAGFFNTLSGALIALK